MSNALITLWHEPAVADPPGPLRRDWLLVIAIVCLVTAEGALSTEVVWRYGSASLAAALALTLPWRRRYPLAMVVIAFGANAVAGIIAIANSVDWVGLNAPVFLLILPYALLRWGSGRDAIVGLGVIAVSFVVAIAVNPLPWAEVFGAGLFLLFPAALGAAIRFQDTARRRAREQMRLREREQLARELHDTVAHHVSAIAIQAQAGRAVADSRTHAPIEALEVIEHAASRTLSEMRHMVRTLRGDEPATLAPAATMSDIEQLVHDSGGALPVAVMLTGELDDLDTTFVSTLYRLTQESLTNAMRHADGAERVSVEITGDARQVHLTIVDDGRYLAGQPPAGLGLRGMAERVTLLGGTFRAGPTTPRGWTVDVTLPKPEIKP